MLGFAPISALPISGQQSALANIVAVGIASGEAFGNPALQRESVNFTGGGGGRNKLQQYELQAVTLRLIGIKSGEAFGRPNVSVHLVAVGIQGQAQSGAPILRKRWIARDEELLIAA